VSEPLLRVEGLVVRFGGIVALDGLSLEVEQGSIQAVIGPNGAGKSTLLNVITGLYDPADGAVLFGNERIDGWAPHAITKKGIARTFQNTELFGDMSAIENVTVGLDRHYGYGLLSGMSHWGRYRRTEADVLQEAKKLLGFVGLSGQMHVNASALSFGNQRRLEIARALATRPQLLVLDEPAAGLRAAEVDDLNRLLLQLRSEQGLTILVIDHVMALVMAISDRICVLNFGRKIAEGEPDHVRKSPEVIKAYLGERAAHAFGP
jgi:branched-chain amino acid transport system ATP-binding protein